MDRKTYYISVGAKEISQIKTASPYELEIKATDEEIQKLRDIFNDMYTAEWSGFIRSHVPYVQYHYDRENDAIDRDLMNVYQMLYELGTPETKRHIESMGILDGFYEDGHTTM
ncbi:hydrolase [Calidifontibacillus erzurumensis]|uniref:Hydrolase n=1 Tax=Calidifontibacillus erzurumensis TaxID=2741433 RepID=A0A8J8GCD8_9BACI|nr:hydrolase [Calidifontibacillus erzurumensis]NSL51360.1 hydrolase [Calidifontibacillus erzurumensis]